MSSTAAAVKPAHSSEGWKPAREVSAPARIEDLAFATVGELASLLHARKITSLALTQMYIERLKRYNAK